LNLRTRYSGATAPDFYRLPLIVVALRDQSGLYTVDKIMSTIVFSSRSGTRRLNVPSPKNKDTAVLAPINQRSRQASNAVRRHAGA
jgi:hypothetical protein